MPDRMIDRDGIARLVPHAGAMCLLDRVAHWDAAGIACRARSHLDPGNPLRRAGRLGAVCAVEYALQAAALHGALTGGGVPQPAGYAAALRGLVLAADRLDDPAHGELRVDAALERGEGGGLIYALSVRTEDGAPLVSGQATIILPRQSCAGPLP